MSHEECVLYSVRRTAAPPALDGNHESAAWQQADALRIDQFRPESSDHRPATEVRLLYDDDHIYALFRVRDRFVLCTHTDYHGDVYKDATVEFFVKPKLDKAYFNFEINCGGTMLLSYNDGKGRMPDGSVDATHVPWEQASQVAIYHSMPKVVSPEIEDTVDWTVACRIPFTLLETYVGPLGEVAGQEWRANFYKCAEDNSHPHWATWSPVGGKLDFHQPRYFGSIRFES
jgi:hypothetical protein